MSQTDTDRIFLTIEAYSSGPIKVTVVHSPNGEGDFFFVEDSQLSDTSNSNRCPTYDLPSESAEVEIAKDSKILLSQLYYPAPQALLQVLLQRNPHFGLVIPTLDTRPGLAVLNQQHAQLCSHHPPSLL